MGSYTYDGSTLLMTASSGTAKILTKGGGNLEITNLILKTTGSDTLPFIQTTNTTLNIHNVTFIGNTSATDTTAANNDGIILGGTTQTQGNLADSVFRGYGTIIDNNHFVKIRRAVYFRTDVNGVTASNNLVYTSSGDPNGGAFYLEGFSSGDVLEGNQLFNNLIELQFYKYGIHLKNVKGTNLVNNMGFDDDATTTSFVFYDSECYWTMHIPGFYGILPTLALESGTINDDTRLLISNTRGAFIGVRNIAVPTGSVTQNGFVSIMQDTDVGHANRIPSSFSDSPRLRLYSQDQTQANDYLDITHDSFLALIQTGTGSNLSLIATNALMVFDVDNAGNGAFEYRMDGSDFMWFYPNDSTDQMLWTIDDSVGNQAILTNQSSRFADHDHALTTNPTFFIHSDLDPDVSNNQWGSLAHDQENFVITTGANTGAGSGPTTDDNAIVLAPRGTERVRVNGSGNLQVGTSNINTAKVSIDGDANQSQLSIQSHSTQSAGVIIVENSSGTEQLVLNNFGVFTTWHGGMLSNSDAILFDSTTVYGDGVNLNIDATSILATGNIALGGASASTRISATNNNAVTNTVTDLMNLNHSSTGTPAAGFGTGILLTGESTTTNNRDMARIQSVWTTATDASRASALQFQTLTGAGSLTTQMTITGAGNVGIGNTAPVGKLVVEGHTHASGTAPSLSSCGTSPSIASYSTDSNGKVTIGTGAVTSCTLTFATAWTNAPACFCNDETTILACRATSTTTTLVLDASVAIDSSVLSYGCFGSE
jgi:hypothetical protein